MSRDDKDLLPCPFCGGADTTEIRPNHYWTGKKNTVVCVKVMHWCQGPGRGFIQLTGKTQEEAIEMWNSRVGAFA